MELTADTRSWIRETRNKCPACRRGNIANGYLSYSCNMKAGIDLCKYDICPKREKFTDVEPEVWW